MGVELLLYSFFNLGATCRWVVSACPGRFTTGTADNVFCQFTATCVSETKRLKQCVVKVLRLIFNNKSHNGQFLRELSRLSYRYDDQRSYKENRKTFI